MHQLEQKISDFIHRHNLIGPQEQRIIVAISGGADSVALLAAMTALGYNCAAAHCNFHLRGEESDRDTRHVADICDRLGVDLSIKHFDIDARRRATGESVEMACRALRYEWFARLADSQQCRTVAVAHHLADNTETMLLNMMRGTGISGLTGMQPRNGLIIRPMLDCTRHEIESYLKERDIRFVNDSTNASNDYLRNRVRNIIIPAMENCFPNASHAMKHTMECLSDTERFYRQALEEKRNVYMSEDNSTIFLLRLAENEPMARLLLYEWIRPYGFNVSQASDMLTKARCGAEFTAGNTRISINRGTAEISDITSDGLPNTQSNHIVDISRSIHTPVAIAASMHPASEFKPERNPRVMCLDEKVLLDNPVFELRHWQQSDRIAPFGMSGTRKLSDVFSDAKLSVNEKRRIWILTRNGIIIWVAGLRASRHFAITPATKRYLRLELIGNPY